MGSIRSIMERVRPKAYGRRQPLILVNGLAEQAESWYRNRRYWNRYFDVHAPNIIAYQGNHLHDRIEKKIPITVDYLVEELHDYVNRYVQSAPYHLVASSLGGKVAIEFAVKYPQLVNRVVLLCPSGMGDEEQLPIMAGVSRNDWGALVRSVFHNKRFVDRELVKYYKSSVQNRRWKTGMLRTIRGTLEHTVREKMNQVKAPTLLVTGEEDRICCPKTAEEASKELIHGHFLAIPKCGHAPQIEKHWYINRLVVHFLSARRPSAEPGWSRLVLAKPTRVK